jgi:hypothetical protein
MLTSPSALIDHVSDTTEDNGGLNKYMLLRQQLITEKSITFNDWHTVSLTHEHHRLTWQITLKQTSNYRNCSHKDELGGYY